MRWEITLLQMLQEMRTPALTAFMEAITSMSESLFIITLIAILYWCVDKKVSLRIGWIVIFSAGINGVVKNIVKMPRPFQRGVTTPIRAKTATSYSFPSGHTQLATTFWGTSMVILRSKLAIGIGSTLIIFAGISRMYLGVHWPTDVIGGIVFGIICVMIGMKLIGREAIIKKGHVLGVSIAVILALILPIESDLAKSIAALWGLTFGAYLEQHYIKFVEKKPVRIQIAKVIIGLGIMSVLYIGLKIIFPSHLFYDMIRYAIILLWISAGAPYIFEKLFNKKYKY